MTRPTLTRIRRYPVKGLPGEDLASAELEAGRGIAYDRAFGLAKRAAPIDPAAPQWLPKRHFHTLIDAPRLAALEIAFDEGPQMLTLRRGGRQVARGGLADPLGRTLLEQFFAAYLGETGAATRIVAAADRPFSDADRPVLSLINLASLADLARVLGTEADPVRFRGNLYFGGAAPWAELAWPGREIGIGTAQLRVIEAIGRCAATNVNPVTAERDLNIPLALVRGYGHDTCGVYAEVVRGGRVEVGDGIELPDGTA